MAVEFDEPEFELVGGGLRKKKQSTLSKWVMSMGLAKTEKGAQDVLLIIAVLIFILAGVVFWMAVA